MTSYGLRSPVSAVRYVFRVNEHEVIDLIASSGRAGYSSTNASGYLHVYNNGPDLKIEDGFWVVALAGAVAVLSDTGFHELFEPL